MSGNHEDYILDDMNDCIAPCTDVGDFNTNVLAPGGKKIVNLDWLVRNLPGMNYVKNRALSYIFSNGLATGSSAGKEKLDKWLYEGINTIGASNFHVLRESIGNAIVYGECGIRNYKGNLYMYPKGTFGVLYEEVDGVTNIFGYFVRKDGDAVDGDIDTKAWEGFSVYSDITDWFEERKMILLDKESFINLRNDTSLLHGISPLLQDTQRVQLLLSVYERLNYDIRYDGPGRIILYAKSKDDGEEEKSTSSVLLNSSEPAKLNFFRRALAEARRIAEQIKKSSSDQVITLSDGFEDKVTHLPRVTKATEFMDWINNEGVIIAQILGMSAVLVEVGKWSGNVSMEKIIDDAMTNTIIPFREVYAVQFSAFISRIVDVEKVFFDKYDSGKASEENESRQKLSNVIRDLSVSAKNLREGGESSAESEKNVTKLISEVSEVLRKSLYDDEGNIRAL